MYICIVYLEQQLCDNVQRADIPLILFIIYRCRMSVFECVMSV